MSEGGGRVVGECVCAIRSEMQYTLHPIPKFQSKWHYCLVLIRSEMAAELSHKHTLTCSFTHTLAYIYTCTCLREHYHIRIVK